jgi:hypothetical protein
MLGVDQDMLNLPSTPRLVRRKFPSTGQDPVAASNVAGVVVVPPAPDAGGNGKTGNYSHFQLPPGLISFRDIHASILFFRREHQWNFKTQKKSSKFGGGRKSHGFLEIWRSRT